MTLGGMEDTPTGSGSVATQGRRRRERKRQLRHLTKVPRRGEKRQARRK